jgi:hypothetical protein
VSTHPLAGPFSVDASAQRIRHYRYAEERLMRMLGGWIALTPELGAKVLFGRHVWDCARHADAWGRRLPELRAPAQQSEPANERVVAFMDLLDGREARHETVERVAGVYRVLKPHLVATYEAHLARANPIYEPPTRRILERCIGEERRHVAAGAVVLERLLRDAACRERAEAWQRRLLRALAEAGGLTGDAPQPELANDIPTGVGAEGDLVALESVFDPGVVEADFAPALDAHRAALLAGDLAGLGEQVTEGARRAVLAVFSTLGGWPTGAVVACAKVGAYRLVKLRLAGPRGAVIVQTQWRRSEDGWRIVEADIVGSEPSP